MTDKDGHVTAVDGGGGGGGGLAMIPDGLHLKNATVAAADTRARPAAVVVRKQKLARQKKTRRLFLNIVCKKKKTKNTNEKRRQSRPRIEVGKPRATGRARPRTLGLKTGRSDRKFTLRGPRTPRNQNTHVRVYERK